jgi:hypothetical protein
MNTLKSSYVPGKEARSKQLSLPYFTIDLLEASNIESLVGKP